MLFLLLLSLFSTLNATTNQINNFLAECDNHASNPFRLPADNTLPVSTEGLIEVLESPNSTQSCSTQSRRSR